MSLPVRILHRAQVDADDIYEWIAKRSPAGAVRWYSAFRAAAASLDKQHERCAQAPESESVGYDVRQRFFKTRRGRTYRLLFTIVQDEVRILRVRGPGQAPVTREDLTT
jgi:plasmid stabilization system protein ParE